MSPSNCDAISIRYLELKLISSSWSKFTFKVSFPSPLLVLLTDKSSLSFVSLNYGDIEITTTALPEGGIGYFNPSSTNFTVSYAKKFSSSISGGMNLKVVSQSISNVSAQGVAIDAGIRYVTGDQDNIKFAISLKNVGPPMSYSGDGLSLDMLNPSTSLSIGMVQRSSSFEMPSKTFPKTPELRVIPKSAPDPCTSSIMFGNVSFNRNKDFSKVCPITCALFT